MTATCEFFEFFQNPLKVFYAGQLLSGYVKLTLTKEKTIRGMNCLFK